MPIALPILNESDKMLSPNLLNISNKKVLRQIFNNCVEFGIFNKTMWVFGCYYDNEDNKNSDNGPDGYQLISFDYYTKNGKFLIKPETINYYYTNEYNQKINNLNDFIGAVYYENTIKFILFDINSFHDKLLNYYNSNRNSDQFSSLFTKSLENDFKLIIYSLNNINTEIIKSNLNFFNLDCSYPMFLEHNILSSTINNKKRMWKTFLKDDELNILYMSLNEDLITSGYFNYYFNSLNDDESKNTEEIYFQVIQCEWFKDKVVLKELKKPGIFYLSMSPKTCISKFEQYLKDYNKCYISKNGNVVTEFTSFDFGYNFSDQFKKFLITKILSKLNIVSSNIVSLASYINSLSGDTLSGKSDQKYPKFVSFKLLNDLFNEDPEISSYIIRNKNWKTNNDINDLIGYEQIINSFGYQNDYEKSVILSSNYVPLPIKLINESDLNKIKLFGEYGLGFNIFTDDIVYTENEENLINFFKKIKSENNIEIDLNKYNSFNDIINEFNKEKYTNIEDFKLYNYVEEFEKLYYAIINNITDTSLSSSNEITEFFDKNFKKILTINQIEFKKYDSIYDFNRKNYEYNLLKDKILSLNNQIGSNSLSNEQLLALNETLSGLNEELSTMNNNYIKDFNKIYNSLSSKYLINDLTSSYLSSLIMSNTLSFTNDFNLFEITSPLYHYLPEIKKCSMDKLSVSFLFENDTNTTFLNDGVIDLDVTCYINDKSEVNKKVGYGNGYTQTSFISWSGDETNGGSETFQIDANRYFNINNQDIYIDFDVCYHQNSEIIPRDTNILIKWLNIEEKIKLNVYGENDHACNTKSFAIKIDHKLKTLKIIHYTLYPVIKINYFSSIGGLKSTIDYPNIECGLINISEIELNKIQNEWNNADDSNVYYYNKEEHDSFSRTFFINDDSYRIFINNDLNVLTVYKQILNDLIYLKKPRSIIRSSELKYMDAFFGINMDNINDHDINFNYVFYLNKKYFRNVDDHDALNSILDKKLKNI